MQKIEKVGVWDKNIPEIGISRVKWFLFAL